MANQTEQIIAACDATASNVPCWRIVPDLTRCALNPGNLALTVERGGIAPPPETHIVANCVTVSPS
jgi:hypothetical protein